MPPRPLVFLNACRSGSNSGVVPLSFPSLFMRASCSAFIGTEGEVPDLFAAAFSQSFYRFFLQGATLGESLHRAKMDLLETARNPLGILYTLYGHCGTALAHAITAVDLLPESRFTTTGKVACIDEREKNHHGDRSH